MALSCPTNIAIKPRQQVIVADKAMPNAFPLNAAIWIDLTAEYLTQSTADRNQLTDVNTWNAYPWLTAIGLTDFKAQLAEPAKHQMISANLGRSAVVYELQALPQHNDSCPDALTAWQAPTPLYKDVAYEEVNAYRQDEYTSKRVERQRIRLGNLWQLTTEIKLSIVEFEAFFVWYRCKLSTGDNSFIAAWLDAFIPGAKAHFAEPWEAKLIKNKWTLSLKLLLTGGA